MSSPNDASYFDRIAAAGTGLLSEGASMLARGVAGTLRPYLPTPLSEFGSPSLGDQDTILSTSIQRINVNGAPQDCLVLLYVNGWQVWDIGDSGAMAMVLSIRGDSAVDVRFLHAKEGWPEVAVVLHGAQSEPWVVKFYSVDSGEYSQLQLRLPTHVLCLRCNQQHLLVCLAQEIHVFDLATKELLHVYPCFPSPHQYGVMALGSRWVAYPGVSPIAPVRDLSQAHSAGSPASMVSSAKDAAQLLGSGLWQLGQVGRRHLSAYLLADSVAPKFSVPNSTSAHSATGTLVVRDPTSDTVVAHFQAHASAIGCLVFDPTGIMVATASVDGHTINVFKIEPGHAGGPPSAYRQLYDLSRGITNSIIQDMSWCGREQWLGCVTARGTVHMWRLDQGLGVEAPLSKDRRLAPSLDPVHPIKQPNGSHSMPVTLRIRPAHGCATAATPPNPAEGPNGMVHGNEVLKGMSIQFGSCHPADLQVADQNGEHESRALVLVASPHGILARYLVDSHCHDTNDNNVHNVGTWALGRPKEQPAVTSSSTREAGESRGSGDRHNGGGPRAGAAAEQSVQDWLSQVEVYTYAAEHLPLWADPSVKFKAVDSQGDSDLASTIQVPWATAAPHKAGTVPGLTHQMTAAMTSTMGSSMPLLNNTVMTPDTTVMTIEQKSCSHASEGFHGAVGEEELNLGEEHEPAAMVSELAACMEAEEGNTTACAQQGQESEHKTEIFEDTGPHTEQEGDPGHDSKLFEDCVEAQDLPAMGSVPESEAEDEPKEEPVPGDESNESNDESNVAVSSASKKAKKKKKKKK
eukprot:TRINITY_DN1315_c0_g1_i12.p1 TRINITY_DN1315_c0_g1~~TRINITY_DN1315_c0_g1_i12.p1  ORF type:complete len:802 (-),score=179.19 TRINITY_DN1315_c0_g1_i12:186-2591(-)